MSRQLKSRFSISLSQGSAEFLRSFSAKEHSHVSTVIENLIEQFKFAKERAELNASITAHYDSLSDAAMEGEAAWGELGLAGLNEVFESEIEQTEQVQQIRQAPIFAHAVR